MVKSVSHLVVSCRKHKT